MHFTQRLLSSCSGRVAPCRACRQLYEAVLAVEREGGIVSWASIMQWVMPKGQGSLVLHVSAF